MKKKKYDVLVIIKKERKTIENFQQQKSKIVTWEIYIYIYNGKVIRCCLRVISEFNFCS